MSEEYFAEVKQAKARKDALALLPQMPWLPDSRSRLFFTNLVFSVSTFFLIYLIFGRVYDESLFLFSPIFLVALLIHEAGHYQTTRFFGYKNKTRLFIKSIFDILDSEIKPETATQASLALLMGPISGIVVGFVCGAIYLLSGVEFWGNISRIFILINALNLLPIYPLDGGRFILSILPQRTYPVQWLLNLIPLAAILFITPELYLRVYLVILGLLAVPTVYQYKMNQICSKLLKRRLLPDTPDEAMPSAAIEQNVDGVQEHISPDDRKSVDWLIPIFMFVAVSYIHTNWYLGFSLFIFLLFVAYLTRPDGVFDKLLKRRLPLAAEKAIPPAVLEKVVDLVQEHYHSDGVKVANNAWDAWLRLKAKRPTRTEMLTLLAVYGLTFVSVGIAYSIYLTTALAK